MDAFRGELEAAEEFAGNCRCLWASRFPEEKENGDANSSLSRGNWEVRVYAADAYVSLADRFG